MNGNPKIAVVGAGPGGLTTAIILRQHDWPVQVFESDASLTSRDQGGTLDLHPHEGQLALAKAGLLQQYLKIARHEDQGSRRLDAVTGAVLEDEIPAPGEGERPEIDRAVLRKLLLDALAPEDVHWDRKLVAVEDHPNGGVALRFPGELHGPFDLVIGADGAWSSVRSAVTNTQPTYTGVTFVELWFSDVDVRHPQVSSIVGRGTMFSLFKGKGIIAQRNGGGAIRVYAAFRTSPEEGDRPDRTLAGITKDDLLSRFDGWAPELTIMIRDAERIAAIRPIVALPIDFRWPSRSDLTLIGDAAHVMPPLGTGVNLAMLDAAELAEALVDAGSHWKAALLKWEARMLERADELAASTEKAFAEMFSLNFEPGGADLSKRR